MAKAKKLPSGQWRALVYSHTEIISIEGKENKKRIYESFTADTKKEAEYLSAEFLLNKNRKKRPANMCIGEAVDKYIELKEPILSPSTITSYKSIRKTYVKDIESVSIQNVSNDLISGWVNNIYQNHSPKTVRNAYGLLISAIELFSPDMRINVSLPAKTKPDLYIPTDHEVQALLKHIKGTELEIAVYLAAFGPMRRGEICAVESSDVFGQNITVSKSCVKHGDKTWSIKSPKTYSGYRTIEYPEFVIARIEGISGRLVKATPDQITHRFVRAVKFTHLPHFRFHDLRHYAASIMHALGVPDQYIMGRGGWSSDRVLKEIYRGEMDDQKKKFTNTIFEHFEDMQHEMQHENIKSL